MTEPRPHSWRLSLLLGLFAAALIGLLFIPRFAQDTAYHQFADQRTLWNIPHALNVLSNLPFVLVGLFGVVQLLGRPRPDPVLEPWQRWAFLILFAFVTLTGIGSMYYHAQPDNNTLYWDRLPLTVVFMAFFCLVLADRVSPRAGPWLLLPLVLAGVGSVTYWHWTELAGVGDVRWYAFVQFFTLLIIPVVLLLFPARRLSTQSLLAVLVWYGIAKALEHLDGPIYQANGLVSGHTLKHLAASLGALWIVLMLKKMK